MQQTSQNTMTLPSWLYVVGLGFFIYLFIQILNFSFTDQNNIIVSCLHFIDFGVHEASHIIVAFLPSIIVAAAGSIGEITFPILILLATIKSKAYFASVFASLWIMLAMQSVGKYMADARAQTIPLMGPGETVQHDWNYIFSQLGWLQNDTIIGGSVVVIGIIIGVLGLLFGAYLIITNLSSEK